jgi:kynurenine formamidase
MVVTAETCEKTLGNIIQEGDSIVIRNDTGVKLTKQQLYMEGEERLPKLTPSAAKWMAKYNPKLIVLDYIRFGEDIAETREFHDILMSKDTNFVEFVENLDKITQPRFYVMTLPYKVQNLDSSFCRAIIIQTK